MLPSSFLDDCDLPSVDDMIEESLLATRTYKYGGFDGRPAAAGGGGSGATGAEHPQPAAAAAAPGTGPAAAARGEEADEAGQPGAGAAMPGRQPGGRMRAMLQQLQDAAAVEGGEGTAGYRANKSSAAARRKAQRDKENGVLFLADRGDDQVGPGGWLCCGQQQHG